MTEKMAVKRDQDIIGRRCSEGKVRTSRTPSGSGSDRI